jgi:N-methylhydantoinase A
MLQTDIRHDVVRSFYQPLAELDRDRVEQIYDDLRTEASELLGSQGIDAADHYFGRSADMRYVGQEYTVNVDAAASVDLAELDESFHEAHRVRYGHSTPGAPVEFVNLRLTGFGRVAGGTTPFRPPETGTGAVVGTRQAVFGGQQVETTVLLRDRLSPGDRFDGPLVVEEQSSTTVIPPDSTMAVDDLGNLIITTTMETR